MIVVCPMCGKEIDRPPSRIPKNGVVCCSVSCRRLFTEQNKPNCKTCGKKTAGQHRQYCSKDCYEAATNIDCQCDACGKSFRRQRNRVGKKTYCSDECRCKSGTHKECSYCGKVFYLPRCRVDDKYNHSFCSTDCYSSARGIGPGTEKEKSMKRCRKYRLGNPVKVAASKKKYYDRNKTKTLAHNCKMAQTERDALHSNYIKDTICNGKRLTRKDIPQSLVEIKRVELKLKRTIKELQNV